MNCDEVREALADRLDGLLESEHAARLDAHTTACEKCAAARERQASLRERVYAPLAVEAAAENLRARIVERAASSRRVSRPFRRLVIPCVASFAVGVLVTLAVLGQRVPEPVPAARPAPVEIHEARPVIPPPLRRIH